MNITMRNIFILFVWINAVIWSTQCLGLDKYDGFQIMRVYPQHKEHAAAVKRAAHDSQGQAEVIMTNDRDGIMEIMISPTMLEEITKLCKELDIPLDIAVPNLPEAIKQQLVHDSSSLDADDFRIDKYNTLSQINTWLLKMENIYHPMLTILTLGQSAEGRPLHVARLTVGDTKGKPAIWLDAGIHSNEWAGPSTVLYFIQQFLEGSDTELHQILEHFVIFIMPIFNVDGYDYTWNEDRFWRKSRSRQNNTKCIGVDLNRNWDFAWRANKKRGSGPCSRNYEGAFPFSEPETAAISSFLRDHKNNLVAYLAYHSYSQFWMMPYGFTEKLRPPNQEELTDLAHDVTEAIESVHGTQYRVGSVANLIGQTFGSSIDYTYNRLNIKYSFGVELRDQGMYGVLLPADLIVPNGEESLAGFKVLCREMQTKIEHKGINEI